MSAFRTHDKDLKYITKYITKHALNLNSVLFPEPQNDQVR